MRAGRRDFLKSSLLGAVGSGALGRLARATAAEVDLPAAAVRFDNELEPLVRLIEETPREKCFEVIAERLRGGVTYRQLMAALFLAGIRNVNPQPPGFKFHCVFMIHAAHQMSLDAPVEDRLVPMFYALDSFKDSQARDVKEGDFLLTRITDELPTAEHAWREFHAGMEAWDIPRADRAIASAARHSSAQQVIEQLWRYGARDYRNIGHKAIFVANAWRTLETIGWQHAEPTLRSLVRGLLDFGRDTRRNGFAYEDQTWLANVALAEQSRGQLPPTWTGPKHDEAATRELLAVLRAGDGTAATRLAIAQLSQGASEADGVWDAVHLAAGELMQRQPGIFGIHTITSSSALHYAFRTAADPETRLLMLLQGVGWMCQFRQLMGSPEGLARGNGKFPELDITALEPAEIPSQPDLAAEQILATIKTDRPLAARQALALGLAASNDPAGGAATAARFFVAARRVLLRKTREEHDFKYATSICEDFSLVAPRWRPQLLATAAYYLRSSGEGDSPVMQRAQAAVQGLA